MRFEKVSYDQYLKDLAKDTIYNGSREIVVGSSYSYGLSPRELYDSIILPRRATMKSAGYDFFAPYSINLYPGETIKLATGIRVLLENDTFLMCIPRSGLGFKYRLQLDNTVGIIDADYSDSSNEGHIMLKLTNDSHSNKPLSITAGEGIMQAIIMKYFKAEEEVVSTKRDGGFGSTNNI